MPKHNPKLDKKKDKKNRDYTPYYGDDIEYKRSYTKYYMILVAVGVVVILFVMLSFIFADPGPQIEKYDEVRLDYEIYSLDQYENNKEPEIKETNVWVNVCHRYDDDCEAGDDGLIKGFYNKLLGLSEGDILNFELIPRCKDLDKDGEDDATGEDALSYGFEDDKLYNKEIVLWFKVREINKSSIDDTSENRLFTYEDDYLIPKATNYISNHYLIAVQKKPDASIKVP